MNMIVPTNPVLMGIIGLAGIPYTRWFRFILPLIFKLLAAASVSLVIAAPRTWSRSPRGRPVSSPRSRAISSTLARVITGLLPPQQGSVLFDGAALPADYRNRSHQQLQQIQMIYQMADTAVNPHQRIKDIIGRPLSFYLGMQGDAKRQRLRELMEMIELDPDQFLDRFPGELSGGQKQRVCIARALAANSSWNALREAR